MDEQSSSSSSSSGGSGSGSGNNNTNSNTTKAKSTTKKESLPISTSSSWTILPADRIEILDTSNASEASSTSQPTGEPAPATAEDEQTNAECKLVEDPDIQAEDVSDGISIISDCESTGRISPHPFLREHLNELNFIYEPATELPTFGTLPETSTVQEIRERKRATGLELDEAATTPPATTSIVHDQSDTNHVIGYRLPAIVQNGLTAVFYVGATLAILAFVGRLRNPEWQVLGGDKPIADLEQRLGELELQNNLMRAEIDIMSKQLNYLSSLTGAGQGQGKSQGQSRTESQYMGRKPRTFKAWPGNGDSMEPVDITKADMKRPYKCPDGNYVEIAAMCMESKPHAESLADEIGNVVNDVLQQSPAFQNFEKVTERLGTLAGKESEPVVKSGEQTNAFHAHGQRMENAGRGGSSEAKSKDHHKATKYNPKHSHSKDYSKEHDHSKEQGHSKERGHSKEYQRRNSDEYDESKERQNRKYGDKSKEQYGGKRRHGRHGNGDNSGSNDWHERMMQHRDHSRQRHEQKRNNNWYIERGSSREQMRSGEVRR